MCCIMKQREMCITNYLHKKSKLEMTVIYERYW